jgi:hypothetical protein
MHRDMMAQSYGGYSGNFLDRTYKATIAYDTTRQNGIKVALTFKRSGRKLIISAKFITHIYIPEISEEGIPPRTFSSFSDSYGNIFLQVFKLLATKMKGTVSASRDSLALRAMHRKSGLKMIAGDGHLLACLKSEYRGTFTEDNKFAAHHTLQRDPFPDEIFGVFVLEEAGQDGLSKLICTLEQEGLRLDFSQAELDECLIIKTKSRKPKKQS